MALEIVPVDPERRDVLARLLQLYQYDFSEIEDGDVGEDGLYRYEDPVLYWSGPDWHPFLLRVDGRWAGFAIVHETGPGSHRVQEFFVMRRFRRRGVGEEAARMLFDRFPGRWSLSQTANNHAARAFWRGVLDRYTGGQYREELFPNERYRASQQSFEAR